jgi:hypothetical protein
LPVSGRAAFPPNRDWVSQTAAGLYKINSLASLTRGLRRPYPCAPPGENRYLVTDI